MSTEGELPAGTAEAPAAAASTAGTAEAPAAAASAADTAEEAAGAPAPADAQPQASTLPEAPLLQNEFKLPDVPLVVSDPATSPKPAEASPAAAAAAESPSAASPGGTTEAGVAAVVAAAEGAAVPEAPADAGAAEAAGPVPAAAEEPAKADEPATTAVEAAAVEEPEKTPAPEPPAAAEAAATEEAKLLEFPEPVKVQLFDAAPAAAETPDSEALAAAAPPSQEASGHEAPAADADPTQASPDLLAHEAKLFEFPEPVKPEAQAADAAPAPVPSEAAGAEAPQDAAEPAQEAPSAEAPEALQEAKLLEFPEPVKPEAQPAAAPPAAVEASAPDPAYFGVPGEPAKPVQEPLAEAAERELKPPAEEAQVAAEEAPSAAAAPAPAEQAPEAPGKEEATPVAAEPVQEETPPAPAAEPPPAAAEADGAASPTPEALQCAEAAAAATASEPAQEASCTEVLPTGSEPAQEAAAEQAPAASTEEEKEKLKDDDECDRSAEAVLQVKEKDLADGIEEALPAFQLTDRAVTLAPYFKLKDAAKFREIWKADYEAFAHKEDCVHYAFCFSEDGERAHCREAYPDAEKVLQHLADVKAALDAVLAGPAELERLEVHGPREEVDKLREPLGPLGCAFFVTEWGFRAAMPAMEQDTACHLYPYFALKQPEEFKRLAHGAYPQVAAGAEGERSLQYAVSLDDGGTVASLRQAHADAEGIVLHQQAMEENAKAVLEGPAELLRMELHGPKADIDKLRPVFEPMGCQFFVVEWGFRNQAAAAMPTAIGKPPAAAPAPAPAAAPPEDALEAAVPTIEEAAVSTIGEAAVSTIGESAGEAAQEVSPPGAPADAELTPRKDETQPPPPEPPASGGETATAQQEAPPPPPSSMSPGSRFASDQKSKQKDAAPPSPLVAGAAEPPVGQRGLSLAEIDHNMENRLERFFSDDKLSTQVQQMISGTKSLTANMRSAQGASKGPELFKVLVPRPYPGVQYRKSKDLQDRHNRFAANGETVEGFVEEDGEWLRISANVYIPMRVGAVQILQPIPRKEQAADPQDPEIQDNSSGAPPQCWSCSLQ